MEALLLVDIQNDFLPGGALAVPGGDQVIPVANLLLQQFSTRIATQDFHPADHVSFADNHLDKKPGEMIQANGDLQILWPRHCEQGSDGAEFASRLNTSLIDHIIPKGTSSHIDSYSGFYDNAHKQETGLHKLLQTLSIKKLFIMGLATDYCVKFTVLDACKLGYEVYVVEDGCKGVEISSGDCQKAIEAMEQAGAKMTNSSKILDLFAKA